MWRVLANAKANHANNGHANSESESKSESESESKSESESESKHQLLAKAKAKAKHHVETLVKPKPTQVIMWNMMMQSQHHVESFGERESKPCKQRTCKQLKRKRKRKHWQASTVGESEIEASIMCNSC